MADKIDPFDVAALEKSLNDSATRVSAIWISYLVFGLYLAVATGNVTHRQLFLEEPIKLPVLNIDLPLVGFFLLAPVLFVIFHAYVLIQVVLLARTAATYNEAVNKNVENDADNARVRQRLANTLFAQIFAGSPRERTGALGWLLQAMAWITLAIAPVLILLTFQFVFLPYHSHLATWTHRLLILIDLGAVLVLWPLALNSRRDLDWSAIGRRMRRTVRFRRSSRWPRHRRRLQWKRLRYSATIFLACLLLVLIAFAVATFPGEPHVNLATGHSWGSLQCDRWFAQEFDRLKLSRVDVVDDEKLAKIAAAAAARGQRPYQGERTRSLRERDLSCADLSGADLRRVDFTLARLPRAFLLEAELTGASLNEAELQGAILNRAQLQSASLTRAHLQGAHLGYARLHGADADNARFHGADFEGAQLEGATLEGAVLQGAHFGYASLDGASLDGALAQYAFFNGVKMRGASLHEVQLQNATLAGDLALTSIVNSYLWGADGSGCSNARVIAPNTDAVLEHRLRFDVESARDVDDSVSATSEAAVNSWIDDVVAEVPASERRFLRYRLATTRTGETDWAACSNESAKVSPEQFGQQLAVLLSDVVCAATTDREHIASGIIRNWLDPLQPPEFRARLARGLLGEDGPTCAATKDLDEPMKARLRDIVTAVRSE